MEISMVPSQFLSVVLEEDGGSGNEDDVQNSYSHHPTWQNQYSVKNNTISDQEMWNLTKTLPKALLAECTVEISRTPNNQHEKQRKPCFDAKVSPVFKNRRQPAPMPAVMPAMKFALPQTTIQSYLPPPPQLLDRSEWMEESMDVQDLLTGVEAVYSDNESDGGYEEAASVSIFPISVPKIEKVKPEKKKQDINKFSYPCEHCPNVYSNRGALWQHSVATHSVEKTCECKICGRKFYRNCSLALHLKSHSEEEYCQCKECGKSFNRLANLERHMKIHVDAEQFPCPHCDKVFRDKTNLSRHVAVHLQNQKSFQCDICNKSYKTQDQLDVHFNNNHATADTSIACSTCGDVFNSIAELMQHDMTHAEKSQSSLTLCKFCGKYFADKNILKQHMLSHTGERLTCATCGIDFTQKSSLLRHIKRMHPQAEIDPSLLTDDKNNGSDFPEGSSDSSSVKDMEEENGNESNSTVEIRKALGSPIKSAGMIVQSVVNNAIVTYENRNGEMEHSDMDEVSENHKNVMDDQNDCDVESNGITDTVKTNNQDETDNSKEKTSEECCEAVNETASAELKPQLKSESTDPLSVVDINTMHTPAVKLET